MNKPNPESVGRLGTVNRWLAVALNWIAVSVLSALVIVVMWGVVTRYIGGAQAKWTEELARFLLIWVSLLGGAIAFRTKDHLGIDYFVSKLDAEVRKYTAIGLQCLVFLVTAAVFVYGGVRLVLDAFRLEQTTPALGWSMGYVYLVIPITGVLICLFGVEAIRTMWSSSVESLFAETEQADELSQQALGDEHV